jgi:hypothetical protein
LRSVPPNRQVETRIAALLALVDPHRTARAFERSARAAHAARHVAPSPRAVLYEHLEDLDDRIVGTTTKLVRAVTSSIDRLVGRTVHEAPDEPTTIEAHAEDEDPEKRALLERFAALERELAKKKRT